MPAHKPSLDNLFTETLVSVIEVAPASPETRALIAQQTGHWPPDTIATAEEMAEWAIKTVPPKSLTIAVHRAGTATGRIRFATSVDDTVEIALSTEVILRLAETAFHSTPARALRKARFIRFILESMDLPDVELKEPDRDTCYTFDAPVLDNTQESIELDFDVEPILAIIRKSRPALAESLGG